MKDSYLEVTFRHGLVLAAYYYLPRESGQKVQRTVRSESGLIIDYDGENNPLGIEITSPSSLTLEVFNRVLAQLGKKPVESSELSPLQAA